MNAKTIGFTLFVIAAITGQSNGAPQDTRDQKADSLNQIMFDYYKCLFSETNARRSHSTEATAGEPNNPRQSLSSLMQREVPGFLERLEKLASAQTTDDDRFEILMPIFQLAQYLPTEEAAKLWSKVANELIDKFKNDSKVCRVVEDYCFTEGELRDVADQCISRLLEETENDAVIAGCHYVKISDWLAKEQFRGGLSTDERELVIRELKELQVRYGAAENGNPRLHRGTDFSQVTSGDIFELENLHVGAVAPEIEGEDADGVSFKLSDYRGRVVLLSFWGNW